jgi:hypothetical protein
MAMNEQLQQIIASLTAKTKNGMAIWIPSGVSAEYMIYLNKHYITIKEASSNDIATRYILKICNSRDGREIDGFVAEKEYRDHYIVRDSEEIPVNPDYATLKTLYTSARESRNSRNEIYSEILNEINQDGAIGHDTIRSKSLK